MVENDKEIKEIINLNKQDKYQEKEKSSTGKYEERRYKKSKFYLKYL